MKKRRNLLISEQRRRPVSEDGFVSSRRQLERLTAPLPSESVTPISPTVPVSDFGGNSGTPAVCALPQQQVVIPSGSGFPVDQVAPRNTVYEQLPRTGDAFFPSLRVDFYRDVWFDGLPAYSPQHYTVGVSGSIVPNATLISSTLVSSRYVVI